MTIITKKTRTARLSLADSIIWAGKATPDGRELNNVQRRVRKEVQHAADMLGEPIEIYACKRHGGCLLEIVNPR